MNVLRVQVRDRNGFSIRGQYFLAIVLPVLRGEQIVRCAIFSHN